MLYRFRRLSGPMELIMPLVHRLLQLIATEQTTKLSRAIILGTILLAALNSSWAQDPGVVTTGKPNPLYPDDAEITFQWNYVCPATDPAHLFVVEQEEEEEETT